MIEFIPVMLFLLGWHPDRPGDVQLERPELLFVSLAACEEAGAKMAAERTEAARGQTDTRYEFRCLPIPGREEFDEAFEQLQKRGS
ncbi:MAG: hypothetical protein AAF692_06900 [Pseudomonadota bacterium]